jgi:hypothetical protein
MCHENLIGLFSATLKKKVEKHRLMISDLRKEFEKEEEIIDI